MMLKTPDDWYWDLEEQLQTTRRLAARGEWELAITHLLELERLTLMFHSWLEDGPCS